MVFPRYSPDLNPLDFSLWEAVMEKMWQNAPPEQETVAACKARLRRTALRLPRDTVRRAVCDIYNTRMQAIIDSKGGPIPKD